MCVTSQETASHFELPLNILVNVFCLFMIRNLTLLTLLSDDVSDFCCY